MITLTEPQHLTAGLWWARRKPEDGNPHGPWLIAGLLGTAPFLVFYLVVAPDKESGDWTSQPNYTKHGRGNNPLDLDKWEFGSRIDIPSDKDRAEYPPREAKVQP